MALTDSRQFSGLVTLATRPLLHIKNLERRRGIEPRTPRLQLGRSPLAVATHGTPGVIRTPNRGFGIRSPHHRQPGRKAGSATSLSLIKTCCYQTCVRARFELAAHEQACALSVASPEHWWAVKDSNLGDPKGIPRLQRGAFGLSANCPKRIVKDLAEGRRIERLGRPFRAKSRIGLSGNYRLGERHQECPTESRYDRRPRLTKRRMQC